MTPFGATEEAVTAPLPASPVAGAWLQHRPASVDLLPTEVLDARRLRTVQRGLGGGLVALVGVIGAASLLTLGAVGTAEADLVAAQAETASLNQQKGEYAEAATVDAQGERIRAAQQQAMVGDVLWSPVIDAVGASAPAGVWLSTMAVSVDPSVVATGTAAAATDPLAQPTVAKVTFTGSGGDHADVAAWLDGLTAVPGLSDARYSVAARSEVDGVTTTQFTSEVGVTADLLSRRFDGAS